MDAQRQAHHQFMFPVPGERRGVGQLFVFRQVIDKRRNIVLLFVQLPKNGHINQSWWSHARDTTRATIKYRILVDVRVGRDYLPAFSSMA